MMTTAMHDDVEPAWDYYGYSTMYARLVDYGLCYLRSGPGRHRKILEWETDRIAEKRQWAMTEIEAAARLHSRIIRLPLRHNLVLQVFFNESCATYWPELRAERQELILHDLTYWSGGPPGVNARIRNANRECGWDVPTITPALFLPIRDRAIRMLCNGERVMPVSQNA